MGRHLAALVLTMILAGCSENDHTPASDGGNPDTTPPATDGQPPSRDGPLAKPDKKGPAPDTQAAPGSCAASPLSLARFPKSMRTTAKGRTFTGWGGAAKPGKAQRVPVIFVHGNGGVAQGWKPIRDTLCKQGYGDLEIWAVTFQDNTCSGACAKGSNTEHATELARLVQLVRGQTQAKKVNIVAVSMGVPATRYYMKSLGGVTRAEVALAYLVSGPNHGLQLCDTPGAAMVNVACAELVTGSTWINKLNKPDETPSGVGDGQPQGKTIIYRTVSFTGDHFFPGKYVSSPKLAGADNRVIDTKEHATIYPQDLHKYLAKTKL